MFCRTAVCMQSIGTKMKFNHCNALEYVLSNSFGGFAYTSYVYTSEKTGSFFRG
jgi:hypothetical protein